MENYLIGTEAYESELGWRSQKMRIIMMAAAFDLIKKYKDEVNHRIRDVKPYEPSLSQAQVER